MVLFPPYPHSPGKMDEERTRRHFGREKAGGERDHIHITSITARYYTYSILLLVIVVNSLLCLVYKLNFTTCMYIQENTVYTGSAISTYIWRCIPVDQGGLVSRGFSLQFSSSSQRGRRGRDYGSEKSPSLLNRISQPFKRMLGAMLTERETGNQKTLPFLACPLQCLHHEDRNFYLSCSLLFPTAQKRTYTGGHSINSCCCCCC